MWSIFSRDPTKDFNYEIVEKVPGLEGKSLWSLHHGKKKGTGEPVSVFVFDVKEASESQVQVAKAAFKRIKTLRHPNILTFLDGLETDKVIYIATEFVVPLETHLNSSDDGKNLLAISWGLHQITKGLAFLVNDCNLVHNNICMASVFVDQAGEWKLGGVDYMCSSQDPNAAPPVKILPVLEKYDPPEKSEPGRGPRGPKWAADMWGLGCLIWEVFNGTLPRTQALKSLGQIPKNLVPQYCELVGANPKSRPNPSKFLEEARKKDGFMDNTFVETTLFLEEIQIKDQNEKTKFFASLTPSLDSFPPHFCRHKILPQLLMAFEYGNAGASVLAPLFKVGKLLESAEYQQKIVPCVVKLFSSPDRATRVKLLQQIDSFVEHLQPAVINDKIFPHVVTGFMDSNPVVRESTIKAMMHMAEKLNYKNLNDELMKHFARLQSKDEEGGIRTNTTICLGKIAGYLNPQIRQKILLSAFTRAFRDPFAPARQAGVLGLAATQSYYSLSEVATRILPQLCPLTQDPDKNVRDQVFKTVKGFISKLEKVSENPELAEEMERATQTTTNGPATSSWAGWAVTGVSSLTSKLYSRSKAPGAPKISEAPLQGTAAAKEPSPAAPTIAAAHSEPQQQSEEEEAEEEEKATEGWDAEDWGDMGDMGTSSSSGFGKSEDTSTGAGSAATDGWDDDDEDWGSLEDTQSQSKTSAGKGSGGGGLGTRRSPEFVKEDSGLPTASTYNWGEPGQDTGDDFFSAMTGSAKPSRSRGSTPQRTSPPRQTTTTTSTKPKPKPTTTPQPPAPSSDWGDGGGGWGSTEGDWGDSGWGSTDDSKPASGAQHRRQEREEKRQQRQRELQEKREAKKGSGAMKLGARKLAAD